MRTQAEIDAAMVQTAYCAVTSMAVYRARDHSSRNMDGRVLDLQWEYSAFWAGCLDAVDYLPAGAMRAVGDFLLYAPVHVKREHP